MEVWQMALHHDFKCSFWNGLDRGDCAIRGSVIPIIESRCGGVHGMELNRFKTVWRIAKPHSRGHPGTRQ